MFTDQRQKIFELAQTSVEKAVALARKIDDPWFRCQSLAMAACHIKSKPRFLRIVNESLRTGRTLSSPNRIVSVSAWPVRAMANRGDILIAGPVEELLQIIAKEPNPVRRADALFLLLSACYPVPGVRSHVLGTLLTACAEMKSWKAPRTLKFTAMVLAGDDPDAAYRVAEMIGDPAIKRQTYKAIENNQWLGPYDFFPRFIKHDAEGEMRMCDRG